MKRVAAKRREPFGRGTGTVAPIRKWGPALLPAPTAPSEGYAGVRLTLDPAPENRCVTPLLDPGSPAQASLPTEQLPLARSRSLPTRLRGPKVRWSFGRSGLSSRDRSPSKPKPFSVPRPFLGRPLFASRFALPHRSASGPRRARGRSTLPAPLPGWPGKNPKALPIPAGGDRTFGHLPLPVPVAGS